MRRKNESPDKKLENSGRPADKSSTKASLSNPLIQSSPKRGTFDRHHGQTTKVLSRSALLELQSSAGNSAVSRIMNSISLGLSSPSVQRLDGQNAIDRGKLIDRTTLRMNLAFSKYQKACERHQQKLRAAAAAEINMVTLIANIALGFAAPGLGRVISSNLASLVPTNADLKIYALASEAMDRSQQIVSAGTSVAKDVLSKGLGEVFSRSGEERFLDDLEQKFSVVLDQIHEGLWSKSDAELSLIFVNYDPELVTVEYYAREIGVVLDRYTSQITPLGDTRTGGGNLTDRGYRTLAYWVELPTGTYLAQIEAANTDIFGRDYRFKRWITKSMADMAIERTKKISGKDVQHVQGSDVRGMTALDLAHP